MRETTSGVSFVLFIRRPELTPVSLGEISSRGPGTLGAARQREALELEGVQVTQSNGGGPFRVSLSTYGWFPESVDAESSGSELSELEEDEDTSI